MANRQRALRCGDLVKLIDPRPILLLGYEQTIDTMETEVRMDPKVMRWISEMGLNPRAEGRVVRAVAGHRLDQLRGAERKLVHGDRVEALDGMTFRIIGRRVRKTGTHVPSYYFSGGYECEPDYEEGYLRNEKTHVCYRLLEPSWEYPSLFADWSTSENRGTWPPDGELWVTKEQVERCTDDAPTTPPA